MLLVGIDWAERHHDVCVMAADGRVPAGERIAEGVAGLARVHELIAGRAEALAEVVVGIETDRGLLVGDARMLADLVRTDRHHHRRVAGDSGLAEAVKVLARGDQRLVCARQRQANILRGALRACYPAALAAFGGDPGGRDAVAVLELARPRPGPETLACRAARRAQRAGRRRKVDARAAAIRTALVSKQLEASAVVADAYGQVVTALTSSSP